MRNEWDTIAATSAGRFNVVIDRIGRATLEHTMAIIEDGHIARNTTQIRLTVDELQALKIAVEMAIGIYTQKQAEEVPHADA